MNTFCSQCGSSLEDYDVSTLTYCPHCRFPVKLLNGRYALTEMLGEGGFGIVYLARDLESEESPRKAVKFLKNDVTKDTVVFQRFQREMAIMAQFSNASSHIVQIYDFNCHDPDLGHYFVMEYAEGVSLRDLMLQRALGVSVITRVFEQLCTVLEEVHEQGVAHRDLKPENIVLVEEGGEPYFVKLLDFGIAKRVNEATHNGLTRGAIGSPDYMAPEQCTGQQIDTQVDQFAIATLLYEMLTGKHPVFSDEDDDFHLVGDVMSKLAALMNKRPIPIRRFRPTLPREMDQVILTALAKQPQDRYPSIGAFRDALLPLLKFVNTVELHRTAREFEFTYDASIPLREELQSWWVGRRAVDTVLFQNPYLHLFREQKPGKRGRYFSLLVDPGSAVDFPVMMEKIESRLGDVSKLSAIFLSHQDPDVAASTTLLLNRYAPNARILCSLATWRLVQHYNLSEERFVSTDKYPKGFRLPTGHTLQPVPAPFCHFAGAMMLYDPSSRILYSGDMFSSFVGQYGQGMWADDGDWTGMRAYHQLQMPSNFALSRTIQAIRNLEPAVEIIAPQHGRWLRDNWVQYYLGKLNQLPVGLDLIYSPMRDDNRLWLELFTRIMRMAEPFTFEGFYYELRNHAKFSQVVEWGFAPQEPPRSIRKGKWVIEQLLFYLRKNLPMSAVSSITVEILEYCVAKELPTPRLKWSQRGTSIAFG